jgi:hypothetical protein
MSDDTFDLDVEAVQQMDVVNLSEVYCEGSGAR